MRRYQLFEFLDQPWLPTRLRGAATAYLTAAHGTTPFPALWAEKISQVLDDCRLDQIVDLGSGSGGPMKLVMKEMASQGRRPQVTLTDLHPVRSETGIEYWPKPVNATNVPTELGGVRTLFLAFHHFAPSTAQAVLRNAFDQREPICIFEATSRTGTAVAVSFLIPLLVFLITPTIRPVSAFQNFFTYLVPVIPLLAFWDGLISQLRTYSFAEFGELTSGLQSADYRWELGYIEASRVPFRTCYLIGLPGPGALR